MTRLVLRAEDRGQLAVPRRCPSVRREAVYVRDQPEVRELHGALGQVAARGTLGGAVPERGLLGTVQPHRADFDDSLPDYPLRCHDDLVHQRKLPRESRPPDNAHRVAPVCGLAGRART